MLLLIDQPVLAEVIKLALTHGVYNTRVAQNVEEALTVLQDWRPHLGRPHLAVIDMDIAKGEILDSAGVRGASAP